MSEKPVLKLPKTLYEKMLESLSILFLLGIYVFIIVNWGEIPDRVPTHFNFAGEPDGWGGKASVLILPIIATFLFKMMFILSKFPHIHNYPIEVTPENAEGIYRNSRKMLITMNFFLTFFLTIGAWEMINVAKGNEGFGMWSMIGFFVSIFGTMGYYMYRMIKLRKK
ncbi:DUF1648 domain-containing protein [Bacillus sp. REN16]|uniref:DUF1648 domain-containing protein n=1 Tax=Bacillus sp. REN16 TaxID=2887296 RepID=UPI001E4E932D|nr:DUF1648 domain-containing protein [Bacillus sp. REN16]MCC3358618.1 DUF1648 domain-containing protein [Bacillus sp. REN16]